MIEGRKKMCVNVGLRGLKKQIIWKDSKSHQGMGPGARKRWRRGWKWLHFFRKYSIFSPLLLNIHCAPATTGNVNNQNNKVSNIQMTKVNVTNYIHIIAVPLKDASPSQTWGYKHKCIDSTRQIFFFFIQRHKYFYLSNVKGNQRHCETLTMEAISHFDYICHLKAHKTKAKNMYFSLFLRFVSLLFLHWRYKQLRWRP